MLLWGPVTGCLPTTDFGRRKERGGSVPFFQDYHFGYEKGSYGRHEWSASASGARMALSYDPCPRTT